MRNVQEEQHEPCQDVLREVENCGIFYVEPYIPELDDEDEDCQTRVGECALCNDHCVEDPLILTYQEVRELARQLNEVADRLEKESNEKAGTSPE